MNGKDVALGIVCPFCPLHCDDVSIESPPDCRVLKDELSKIRKQADIARVGDVQVTMQQAEQAAKKLIEESEQVVALSRSTTLGQAKAIVDSGWRISVQCRPTFHAVKNAIARCGVVAATLSDVKQHADAIVVLGDIDQLVPRLMEKLGNSVRRSIIEPLSGKFSSADTIAGLATDIRQGQRFSGSAYVAFILDCDAFDAEQEEPIAELLIETIIWMNLSARQNRQRAVLLLLDPLASLRCVSAWSSDQRLLANEEFDPAGLMIQLGEPSADQLPVGIQIGGPDSGPKQANIYLPASTAGIHHADAVIRGDSTVTLPLEQIQPSSAPSVADWIARLAS